MHLDIYLERGVCVLRRVASRDVPDAPSIAARVARGVATSVIESERGVLLSPSGVWVELRRPLEDAGLRITSICLVEKPENAPEIDDTPF